MLLNPKQKVALTNNYKNRGIMSKNKKVKVESNEITMLKIK